MVGIKLPSLQKIWRFNSACFCRKVVSETNDLWYNDIKVLCGCCTIGKEQNTNHTYANLAYISKTNLIFFYGSRVASHVRRSEAQRDPISIKEHMPPEHQKYLTYNPEEFKNWAECIGEFTSKVVNYFLYSGKEPEQGYKYCVSLMKMTDRYGQIRIERACERLLSFTSQPSLRSIATILKNGQDKLPLEKTVEERPVSEKRSKGITRGASAYRNGGDASC